MVRMLSCRQHTQFTDSLWIAFRRSSVAGRHPLLVLVLRGDVADLLHPLHLGVLPAVQVEVLNLADVGPHASVDAGAAHADEDSQVV